MTIVAYFEERGDINLDILSKMTDEDAFGILYRNRADVFAWFFDVEWWDIDFLLFPPEYMEKMSNTGELSGKVMKIMHIPSDVAEKITKE